jgi:hypothetical protein
MSAMDSVSVDGVGDSSTHVADERGSISSKTTSSTSTLIPNNNKISSDSIEGNVLVRCPSCPPSSQKRFKVGRSIRNHATSVHLPPDVDRIEAERIVREIMDNVILAPDKANKTSKKRKRDKQCASDGDKAADHTAKKQRGEECAKWIAAAKV